jgi:hypothetical protein
VPESSSSSNAHHNGINAIINVGDVIAIVIILIVVVVDSAIHKYSSGTAAAIASNIDPSSRSVTTQSHNAILCFPQSHSMDEEENDK